MQLSVIIPIHNRSDLLAYGLESLEKQSLKDFEVLLIDDMSTEDLSKVYRQFNLIVRHIKINPHAHQFYKGYHTPALAINIGIRRSSARIIAITQPECLHDFGNFELGFNLASQGNQVFGQNLLTHRVFTPWLTVQGEAKSYDELWQEGCKYGTLLPGEYDNGYYWYIQFLPKKQAEAIGGVDEAYLQGVYGEDDNFRDRLRLSGLPIAFEPRIRCLHINHEKEEDLYVKQDRRGSFWEKGALFNRQMYRDFCTRVQNGDMPELVANKGLRWGDERYILEETVHERVAA